MATLAPSAPAASPSVWTGRVLSGLFVAFMLGASIAPKLLGMPVAAETIEALGWSADYVLMIGLLELAFVLLYLFPRTSVLGAVLMTALLGGAMATHIRAGSPLSATRSSASTSRCSCGAACGCAAPRCARCSPFAPARTEP